jgi:ubiquinone/menaquinone biosynthesis C-methylase UbiE
MHDWMEQMKAGQRVLDLGAGAGSLKSFEYACTVVCVDSDKDAFANPYAPQSVVQRVIALGESLPFPASSFDLVLCHHALEHIANVSGTLQEISRVLKSTGRLFISVPNGYGLCDGIYRYVFEGGDHVNRFHRPQLVAMVEKTVGLRLTAWQKLYSSFAYLARVKDLDPSIFPQLAPRLRRFARLPASVIAVLQGSLYVGTRIADRIAGVDWALYGWALYFERSSTGDKIREDPPFVNVCLYCGSGYAANEISRRWKVLFRCPGCSRLGIYFPPFRNAR